MDFDFLRNHKSCIRYLFIIDCYWFETWSQKVWWGRFLVYTGLLGRSRSVFLIGWMCIARIQTIWFEFYGCTQKEYATVSGE